MECRQAVQEDRVFSCILHHLLRHLIRGQFPDSLFPYLVRLSHGYPHVRIDYVSIPGAILYIFGKSDRAAAFLRVSFARLY